MTKPQRQLDPHVIAYGIALLCVLAGTVLILLAYNVIAGFADGNIERVSFGVMLLVGLPLVFIGQLGSGFLERRWGVSPERLEAIGIAFLLANLLVTSGMDENGLKSVTLWAYLREVTLVFCAVCLFQMAWMRCLGWIKVWWARRKDQQADR